MRPTITTFTQSPDHGQGLAHDTRVRWALEEVGQPYEFRLISFAQMKEPAHRVLHPFGQIPTFEAGSITLLVSKRRSWHLSSCFALLLAACTSCDWFEETEYANCVVADDESNFIGDYLLHDDGARATRILTEECIATDQQVDGGDGKAQGRVRWFVCYKGPDCDEAGMH